MEEKWLSFGKSDLSIECQQIHDEGAKIPSELATELEKLLAFEGVEDDEFHNRVRRFLEQSAFFPILKEYPYNEPSDLTTIQKLRPKIIPTDQLEINLTDKEYLDRIYGAWLGRCSGCLLGKPIEGLQVSAIWPYLRETNQFPLVNYLDSSLSEALKGKFSFETSRGYIDQIDHMVEDDDLNYTVISLAVMSHFGWGFTPDNVTTFWLENLPAYHTFTAERVAYRNFLLNKYPPDSAFYCNPYREWIGAQIRGDFWGYVCPGEPARAATLAWRDASLSHIKNGIYGEMWVAAMCSAAASAISPRQVLEIGLSQIPEMSRLSHSLHEVIEWYDSGKSVEEAVDLIHQHWDDSNPHHWCHTLSNAQIVALGLLWGEGNFERSISWAVTSGFDTDCNGATVGSVIGMLQGANRLPGKWINKLNNKLDTGITGYHHVLISDLAERTLELAKAGGFNK